MKHSRSSLFLMELIIAILFFSMAGAVCIRLFAASHLISVEAVNQNQALSHAQNLAESYLALEGDMDSIAALYPEAAAGETEASLLLSFGADWECVSPQDAVYVARLDSLGYQADTGLISADITVTDKRGGKEIFSLHIDHHIPARRSAL